MPFDGISPTAAIAPALTFGYRVIQTGYELAEVPSQARLLLNTISQVSMEIKHAKILRRKKSGSLDIFEKEKIDATIANTESALDGLAALVEAPRVDMMTRFGRVSAGSRVMWVVRDANNVPAASARLGIACTALNTEITIMRCRGGKGSDDRGEDDLQRDHGLDGPPPPYQATRELLHLRRQATRRNSVPSETTRGFSEPALTQTANPSVQLASTRVPSDPLNILHELEGTLVWPPLTPLPPITSTTLSSSHASPSQFPLRSTPLTAEQVLRLQQEMEPLFLADIPMEAETLVAGHRQPLLLRWNEPSDLSSISRAFSPIYGRSPPASGAVNVRRSKSQSWLAFQASQRPISVKNLGCA